MNAAAAQPVTGGSMVAEDIGVLLVVWAHPDDEAYSSAGLMSLVRAAGHRVVVATATRGEHGTEEPDLYPPHQLAAIREREMAASLAAVDVSEHHWLGHHDGELHRVPTDDGVRHIAELIEQIHPHTIVTFGPDGLTGHNDHRTVSNWVSLAWRITGREGRLWHATFTPEFHQRWDAVNATAGLWMPGAVPPCDPPASLALAIHCDEDLLDRKLAALRGHASQTGHLIAKIGVQRYRRWWGIEAFIDGSRRAGSNHYAAAA
jgi:LmbE family N-acetylglucosaminyl deacetylase